MLLDSVGPEAIGNGDELDFSYSHLYASMYSKMGRTFFLMSSIQRVLYCSAQPTPASLKAD